MNRCEMCGLPEKALVSPGYTCEIIRKPDNAYKSSRKVTIWCCSENCGIQALAMSQYGSMTSKWTITLAQARSIFKRSLKPCPTN